MFNFGKKNQKVEEKIVVKTGNYVGKFLIGGKEVYGCYVRNTANRNTRIFITEEGIATVSRTVSFKQLTKESVTKNLRRAISDYENNNCQPTVRL